MVSPRQKRQQLRRAEVLVRNRLAAKQPTISKSCDTEKQLSKPAQPNEPRHISNQGSSSTRTTWCKKRNEEKETFCQKTVKRKNVMVRLLL